jgi:hypothetical protein
LGLKKTKHDTPKMLPGIRGMTDYGPEAATKASSLAQLPTLYR